LCVVLIFKDILNLHLQVNLVTFLDIPDLAALSQLSPVLAVLASDPALHRTRILVVAPSRVSHSLFGRSLHGVALRPTIRDLVDRGVMRGLGIVRRWRMGLYFYSPHVCFMYNCSVMPVSLQLITIFSLQSVKQYENGLRLQRRQASTIISSYLYRRSSVPGTLRTLHQSHILPDVESSSLTISRSLLPVMRKLKWSIQKDQLARVFRRRTCFSSVAGCEDEVTGFSAWLETKGRGIVKDGERVRLAICPGIRQIVGCYENLTQ